VVPRRTLVLVAAALVVALLGTVIGVALANSGGGSGDSKGHDGKKATPNASQSRTRGGSSGPGSGSGENSAKDSATGPSTTPSSPRTTAAAANSALPAGWVMHHDPEGFSIALPKGWKRVGDNGFGSGSRFAGSGGANLLVDWTHSPGKSALGTWKQDSAAQGPGMPFYHQIKVVKVYYRGYDAADWEYTRHDAGKPVHILNRGMVTDARHGYALMFTTPAGAWSGATDRLALKTFFATFKPAE
jgi:hypothetical protein